MITLYSFAISHFSEKARWALDLAGLPYEERLLVPGPHMLKTRRMARGTSVPILVHDGRVVQGSSRILDYLGDVLGAHGMGSAAAEASGSHALERLFDHALGLGVQRIAYSALLRTQRAYVTDLWSHGAPAWAEPFYKVGYPLVARAVGRMYKTTDPVAVDRAIKRFNEAVDVAEAKLAQGPYLDGEGPGRADITFAALLAPLAPPANHPLPFKPAPAELASFIGQYSHRPALAHVAKMYREHRHRAAPYRLGPGGSHLS